MTRRSSSLAGCAAALALLAGSGFAWQTRTIAAAAAAAPRFQVDPFWPKMPPQWILGQVSGVAVGPQDHVWVLQRPWTLNPDEKAPTPGPACCSAAPPVMEFDAAGTYIQGWGGPGAGYEWPRDEHGIFVDYKGNVWLTSAGGRSLAERTENFIVKFTKSGKFLLQIGRRGQSRGSLDTANLNNAADVFVYRATNEVFVADGYVNRRVIVFDADTGAFKRMWGAYGKPPDDRAPNVLRDTGPAPQQFNIVHGIRVSDDGLVYVADRMNDRVQVFGIDGHFIQEMFIDRRTNVRSTAMSVALSSDAAQQWLYVADAANGRVHIFERKTLRDAGGFGRIGHYAGQFVFLHGLAVDSKGNVYTAEVGSGRRAQKFVNLDAAR